LIEDIEVFSLECYPTLVYFELDNSLALSYFLRPPILPLALSLICGEYSLLTIFELFTAGLTFSSPCT
jgi:hypothetical protein